MKTPGRELARQIDEIKESKAFDVRSGQLPTWCPGCGYFGIHFAINEAIQELGLEHHEVAVVSGIGCSGRYPFFSNTYGFHSTHGRSLPVATGLVLGRPDLTVFAVGGDGDGLGIGGGHFPHAARRDVNVNYVLFDNSIYGLTKGQPSPSTPRGFKTKASPEGSKDAPLNATLLALSYGASFVARLFAGDPKGITAAIMEGVRHKGFSFYHVYTSCVTFDKQFKTWAALRERVRPLEEDWDRTDRRKAIERVLVDDDSLGILYQEPR